MGKYCDTKILEKNWFDWLVSSAVPSLEHYRSLGLLWTKVLGEVEKDGKVLKKDGKTFTDPCHPHRSHCIALPTPIYFESHHDEVPEEVVVEEKTISLSDLDQELNLLSDSWLYRFDNPLVTLEEVIPQLRQDGYRLEQPTEKSWHAILQDVNNMCNGIATKFNPPSEDEHVELAHDALLQVMKKLFNRKLVFTPGRAPVFNLLTTTIYRCMYSIKNKCKNQRNGMNKLIDDMQAGALPDNIRSFRAAKPNGCRSTIKTS